MYILITGANGGVGFGLAQRLAHYCSCFPPTATDINSKDFDKITLIFACRNVQKAQQSICTLQQQYPPAFHQERLQVDILQLDLTSTKSILKASQTFRQRYPRLDVLYCNAGVLPIEGVDWVNGPRNLIKNPLRFFTDVSSTLRQPVGTLLKVDDSPTEEIGYVFMANVLGHYMLIRELEPNLKLGRLDDCHKGGRVVWTGSQTSDDDLFQWTDIQGLKSQTPYESSKAAMELLCTELNAEYSNSDGRLTAFVSDPGVVSSSIVSGGVTWIMQYLAVIPVLWLASWFLDSVVYTSWNGALSLFYLSGLMPPAAAERRLKGDDPNPTGCATQFKYCSRNAAIQGKEYVERVPLLKHQSKQHSLIAELEGLRLRLLKESNDC